jgi:hypothetical protein
MNAKFTKGPWRISIDTELHQQVISIFGIDKNTNRRYPVAGMYDCEEARANTRLIASAPELYEACKTLLMYYEICHECDSIGDIGDIEREELELARAAILKVEGGGE